MTHGEGICPRPNCSRSFCRIKHVRILVLKCPDSRIVAQTGEGVCDGAGRVKNMTCSMAGTIPEYGWKVLAC